MMKSFRGPLVILIISVASLISCRSYVQVFKTEPLKNISVKNNVYYYENDTILVKYYFWSDGGVFTFGITNKLEIPIYIDWKKSSFIKDFQKYPYWQDRETTNSISVNSTVSSSITNHFLNLNPFDGASSILRQKTGESISSTQSIGVTKGRMEMVREERITFIPPHATIVKSTYTINGEAYFFATNSNYEKVPRNDNPKKKTKVYSQKFNLNNSPIVFSNFLSYSLTEDFKEEAYINNSFYLSEVNEIDERHFHGAKRDTTLKGFWYLKDSNGKILKYQYWKNPNDFYYMVPKRESISKRKSRARRGSN